MCNKYDGDIYLSGKGGKQYMTQKYFQEMEKNNINIEFIEQNTTAQYPYTTLHYLLAEGPEWVSDVIN